MKLNYPTATTIFGVLLSAVPSVVDASTSLMRGVAVVGAVIALLGTYLSWRNTRPCVLPFNDSSWRVVGNRREILMPARAHGKRLNSGTRVEVTQDGGFAECITDAVTMPNGDVLIRISADGETFTGRIVIG